MKHISASVCAFLILSMATPSRADFLEKLGFKKSGTNQIGTTSGLALSQEQVVSGLKEALSKGVQQAVATLGKTNGFMTNAAVKIPMPQKLQSIEKTLRALKQERLADDFVLTMNRAAEEAVPAAAKVFGDAIKQLSPEDGKAILTGGDDAATKYFRKTMATNLFAQFLPIVKKATETNRVTSAYKNLMAKSQTLNLGVSSNSFGNILSKGNQYLGTTAVDVDAYVTEKAMDGLFTMVAAEEKKIRENPTARTTELLQNVFGALKK